MYYCFVEEDIRLLKPQDPLLLQYQYAELIDKCLLLSLKEQVIRTSKGAAIDFAKDAISKDVITKEAITEEAIARVTITDEAVFLRATCESVEKAWCILEAMGCGLVETSEQGHQIENWYKMNLTKRSIFSERVKDLVEGNFKSGFNIKLQAFEKYFIKTVKKGFSLQISKDKVLDCDREWIEFLQDHTEIDKDELLITGYYDIKMDSLGSRETRHFVMNGVRVNSSRTIHSLKHSVMPSHIKRADDIVAMLSVKEDFPKNYVLDLGEFVHEGDKIIDIVELNPITLAMCYVNNSIFSECHNAIEVPYQDCHIGYEYCLDMLNNPEQYPVHRISSEKYEYRNDKLYVL